MKGSSSKRSKAVTSKNANKYAVLTNNICKAFKSRSSIYSVYIPNYYTYKIIWSAYSYCLFLFLGAERPRKVTARARKELPGKTPASTPCSDPNQLNM